MSDDDVADVPPAVVTVTSTVPVPAGLVAVIVVPLTTVTPVAAEVPKFTAVALPKSVPEMVTDVPPDGGPKLGKIPVTAGATIYVKWSADDVADVPPAVVTVTSTVPAAWAGLVTVIRVSPFTVMAPVVFAVLPNFTVFAPVKPVPVMITDVPPVAVPKVGEMLVTVGTAT